MHAKENALRIIRFDNPEKIDGYPCHGMCYFGCNHEGFSGGGHHVPVGSHWEDIWGTVWYREHEGVMGFPRGNPLADIGNLATYKWPDPNDERICKKIYETAKDWDASEKFLVGSHRDTLWEKAYMLVGMENIMCYFYTNPEDLREVFHRIMDFQLGIAKHYLSLGVNVVSMSDDLGTQHSTILQPQMIFEFLLPEYRRLFSLYKQHNVLVDFHSCGHIMPLLDMFMDLGVNILNPVQASANDLIEVRRKTQNRMTLSGGISSQIIAQGPVEVIRREVAQKIYLLGNNGGYMCGPDQSMPWPEEHIQAVWKAIEEFGHYPLIEHRG